MSIFCRYAFVGLGKCFITLICSKAFIVVGISSSFMTPVVVWVFSCTVNLRPAHLGSMLTGSVFSEMLKWCRERVESQCSIGVSLISVSMMVESMNFSRNSSIFCLSSSHVKVCRRTQRNGRLEELVKLQR